MMDNLLIQAWKSLGPVFRFWRIVLTELVLCARSLTKEERRRLFALRVAQEDEEMRMRRYQEEVWKRHLEHCMALGLDPTVNSLIPSLFQLRLLFEITVCFRFIDSLINFSFFFLPQMTPVNFESTPFGVVGAGSPVPGGYPPNGLPVFWDPVLGAWQPYPEDAAAPVNANALTPISETSSGAMAKVSFFFSVLGRFQTVSGFF